MFIRNILFFAFSCLFLRLAAAEADASVDDQKYLTAAHQRYLAGCRSNDPDILGSSDHKYLAAGHPNYAGVESSGYLGVKYQGDYPPYIFQLGNQRYFAAIPAHSEILDQAQEYLLVPANQSGLEPEDTYPSLQLKEVRNPARESKSLPLPESWADRKDVYDARKAFKALLTKAKISGNLPIKNNTDQPATLTIAGKQLARGGFENASFDITIYPHTTANYLNLELYEDIVLKSHGFLDIFSTEECIEVAIDEKQQLLFPRTFAPFEFVPTIKNLEGSQDKVEREKITQYNGHLGYMRQVVCKQEEIDAGDLYLQRQRLYEEYRIEKMVKGSLPFFPRIPLNLFNIWLNDPNSPEEPPEELLALALKSSKLNPPEDGWNYFFLVQNKDLLPITVKYFENTPVKVVNYKELLGDIDLQDELDEAIAERKFGMGSDILRVAAVDDLGGGYLDIDMEAQQSLKVYFYLYNSLFGIEPMSEFIGNAFMASSANHPIMKEMTRLIKRNFQLKRNGDKSFYSNAALDNGFNTIVQTGPCVTTVAVYNAAGKDSNIDGIFPSEAFYPAHSLKRPEFGIPRRDDSLPLSATTLHLWRTTWVHNGSKG